MYYGLPRIRFVFEKFDNCIDLIIFAASKNPRSIRAVVCRDGFRGPPPSVTPLPEQTSEEADSDLTLRERLEAHRTQAECAGCHAKIDPLGFALENYGPTGVWRDVYENGRKVDSSGVLFGRREFGNIVEFKDAILAEPDRFARAFAVQRGE